MATTSGSLNHAGQLDAGHLGELSTPDMRACTVSRSMLLSALSENVALSLQVVLMAMLGAAIAWGSALVLPITPGLTFYAALSASVPVIYLANLADVRNVRDTIVCLVPGLMVWGILLYDVQNATLLGLTLFTHVMVAFFAGFSRVSGSLRDMGLWPVLFGFMGVSLMAFVEAFLF